jgi:predicted small lipoprotein YifL
MRPYTVSLCLTLVLAGCGKKGPLVYPEMLIPAAPSNLNVQQTGSSLKVSFTLPSKDLAGRRISAISGVAVFKRDVSAALKQSCTSCPDDYALFRKMHLETLPAGTQRYGDMMVLMDDDVATGRSYTYRVSTTLSGNLEGASSLPATAALVAAPLPPVAQAINHPTEVQLEFVGLPPDGGTITGYNIYRTTKGGEYPYLPLNSVDQSGSRFVDTGMERSTTYIYRVRSVARLSNGSVLESLPSNEVEGRLKDDE